MDNDSFFKFHICDTHDHHEVEKQDTSELLLVSEDAPVVKAIGAEEMKMGTGPSSVAEQEV